MSEYDVGIKERRNELARLRARTNVIETELSMLEALRFIEQTENKPSWVRVEDFTTLVPGEEARVVVCRPLPDESWWMDNGATVSTSPNGVARFIRNHHTSYTAVGADGSIQDVPEGIILKIWKKVKQ